MNSRLDLLLVLLCAVPIVLKVEGPHKRISADALLEALGPALKSGDQK